MKLRGDSTRESTHCWGFMKHNHAKYIALTTGVYVPPTEAACAADALEMEQYAVYRDDGSEDFQATARRYELAQSGKKPWASELTDRLYFFTIDCGGRGWYRLGALSGGLLDGIIQRWRIQDHEFDYDLFHAMRNNDTVTLRQLRASVLWKSIARNGYALGDSAGFIALHWRARKVSRFFPPNEFGLTLAGLRVVVTEAKAKAEHCDY
jgi:hypothetical protein